MLETYWLCNKSYNSKRELKMHIIPAPHDYKRLIRSTKWHDPLAIRARVVVLEWVRKITRSTRSRSEWLQDWEAECRQKSPQSITTLTNQDQQTNHMMNRLNSVIPLSESYFQPYPTRPDMGKMIKCKIFLVPQNTNAIVQQALTKYRALLKDHVPYENEAMDPLPEE
ncbi:hypothetical protein ACJMK2_039837 [Sinanodonta woodiana]|uniref:Uncharacterized protein n=1 Tax=Sinanodonta woodiana TaxID=1069815 RepID=A0ABD3WD66_SINWO